MCVSFWIDWHTGCQANNSSFWCLKHLTLLNHTHFITIFRRHTLHSKGISFIWMHCFTLRCFPRALEKTTLWTKSYTQAMILISTQTPEVIMSLCKLSTALGTKSPLTSSLRGLSKLSLSIWALWKYRLGWTSPPGKNIPVRAVIQLFCSNRTRRNQKNLESGSQHGTRF